MIVSYKDDATAFNGLKKGTISGKGVVNNKMSNLLMQKLEKEEGVPTHFVEELSDRETSVTHPSFIRVVREVTGIREYSNAAMSKHFPKEDHL